MIYNMIISNFKYVINMKRYIILLVAIAFVMTKATYSQTISGTKHDFSAATWNTTGEICKVCHTPHKADITVTNAPLWNHQVTATASYTLYSSYMLDATLGQPDESSKLCLSCHDGTVALENFGAKPTAGWPAGSNFITGDANLGTDLSNDHPISFTYDATLATTDGRLFDPTTHTTSIGGTISTDMLIGGKMQCASCHDVHNRSGVAKLLKMSNTASALCLTCHNK
jgi:predicted CXXCH cytochrome family protein